MTSDGGGAQPHKLARIFGKFQRLTDKHLASVYCLAGGIMVHADSSNFAKVTTKAEVYEQILSESAALFEGQRNWVCNLSNAAALLWHGLKSLPTPSNRINWAGFYVSNHLDRSQLILAPFQGKVACQTIKIGKGVCGTAAETGETQLVRDVHKVANHIACDSETNSEIVVPIKVNEQVVAVIDIDCEALDGFTEEDQAYLEKYAKLLSSACDWP